MRKLYETVSSHSKNSRELKWNVQKLSAYIQVKIIDNHKKRLKSFPLTYYRILERILGALLISLLLLIVCLWVEFVEFYRVHMEITTKSEFLNLCFEKPCIILNSFYFN
jgi:hypothetical protein